MITPARGGGMSIRVLFASSDPESLKLQRSMLEASVSLVCFELEFSPVSSLQELRACLEADQGDVVLFDWSLAEAQTPDVVRELLKRNSRMRIIVLLPQSYRQYRQSVWEAGACSSIPKEHMDQEWLSSILCVMQRAMQREKCLLQAAA
jgi:DNA-binding NarL/FixJ family response regulator